MVSPVDPSSLGMPLIADDGESIDSATRNAMIASPKATPSPPADPLPASTERFKLRFGLSGVAQSSGVVGSWWNLSEQYAPDAGYNPDRVWGETWIKPSVTSDLSVSDALALYSGLSYVGSGNIGFDVFEQGNQGVFAVEDAYFGSRIGSYPEDLLLDVSYGRQAYKIGSGMLISVGAMNGFERGATTTFARRAWEEAGLVKLKGQSISLEGFYLNPNELPSTDTFTRLAGTKLEAALGADQYLGLAYFNVFESQYPYVKAPIQFLPNGREGLNTIHGYSRWKPLPDQWAGFYVAGDYAYQWNDRIAMSSNAFSGEIGNQFLELPKTPKLIYTFRSFQGDDPATAKFEKFDPLFYEGAPPLWASGSNGSFSFLNSNVQLHRIQLSANVTKRDTFSFYYWHLMADQINSPLQFGQAGRITVSGGEPELVSGVPDSHLSDDFYVENFRVINPNWYVTTGFAVSIPGRGLRELVDDPVTWYGALLSLAFQY
ncbi:MAG: hypothetical protein KGQ51_18435 [Planctomycetes bacterium]|nr:hypothetical protein [Planctomycetota bacterium]